MSYVPELGDIVTINCNPQDGTEISGRRPALVVSPKKYNKKTSLAIFCPITNTRKKYPWIVELPDDCEITGIILSDQIKSFDWKARKAEYVCKVSSKTILEVKAKILPLLKA